MVGQNPVQLFGHRTVVRAQSGFDVGDRNVELGGRERPCEGRVRVTVDQDPIRSVVLQDPLDPFQHAARHGAMAKAVDV